MLVDRRGNKAFKASKFMQAQLVIQPQAFRVSGTGTGMRDALDKTAVTIGRDLIKEKSV
jgi:hypothetical protein